MLGEIVGQLVSQFIVLGSLGNVILDILQAFAIDQMVALLTKQGQELLERLTLNDLATLNDIDDILYLL